MKFDDIINYFNENKDVFIPFGIFILFALIGLVSYFFSTKQRVKRKLSNLRDQRINSLRNREFSRISGKAKSFKEPFVAPLSQRKCVFYRVKLEQKKRRGKNRYWDTIIDQERYQEFFIEQDGEYAIVKLTQYPKNFLCHLMVDKKTSSSVFNKPSPEFEALLNQHQIKSKGYFGLTKQLRYKEAIIEIDETITVAGTVNWTTLTENIDGYNYSKIAELTSTDKQKLIITDLPNLKSKKRR